MPPIKISLIMFSLIQKRRKMIDFFYTVDVKSVMKSIHFVIGASHATPVISETTLTNGRQAIKKLIILFIGK